MLAELGVSTSGYYGWSHRKLSKQATHRKEVKKQIQTIYEDSKQIYGAPKITKLLQQKGECISERTVGLYMRQMGIRACWVKHYTVTTQSSCFDAILVNILQEQFNPPRPDTIWCSDITYIWTTEALCIWPVSWIYFLEKSLPGIYPGSWMHLALLGCFKRQSKPGIQAVW